MQSEAIGRLRRCVSELYGAHSVSLYGSSDDEEYGTGFTIAGIRATFLLHTQDGMLRADQFDIQVESIPPGEYIYTDVVSLERFIDLIAQFAGPEERWPVRSE